jgi:hypothetical protein
MAAALLALLALVALLAAGNPGRAGASVLHDLDATPAAAPPSSKALESATPVPTRPPARWERTVLQALADAMSWPTDVREGPGGKLSVQLEMSSEEWYQASIRPFETDAGAGAAFDAEMQDLRLAGLRVSPTLYFSYPAYSASLDGEVGQPIERRLAWQTGELIFSVAVHGSSEQAQEFDVLSVGRHLLYLAVQQGLPAPPGGVLPPGPQGGTPTTAPAPPDCGVDFVDVPATHWAASYVDTLACDGIVSGYADGTFRPQNPTTRAQLTKMLALAQGWDLASPTIATFPDVPPTHIFFTYVETAVREHVVSGYPDGQFRPDGFVTRAQVAKMLVQSSNWSLAAETVSEQCDVPRSHWAWEYIQAAIEHGAFRGYANGCFYPDAVATRAQLAKVLVTSRP